MTDPASIFSIVSGAAGLVLQLGNVINDLHNVCERYRLAQLTISSMRHNLTTVQWAWRRIKTILDGWEQDDEPLPDDTIELFAQLSRSLQGGSLVISALEDDLKRFQEIPDPTRRTNPTQRARIVWNEQTLKDHQERIRDQVSSMTLVLEVMRMPEPAARKQALDRGERVFQQSDESAFSIVPSKFSRSIRDSESLLSFESEPSLVYHELSVDSDLFTARVYKRNYRTAFIRKLLRKDKVLSVKSQGALDRVQGVPAAFETVQKDPDTETVSGTASESSVASLELPDNWIVCPAEEWGTSKQKARDMAETRGSERTALILTWMGNMPTFRRIGDTVKPLYHHMEPIELAFYNGHLNVVKLFLSIGGSLDHCTHLAPEIVHAAILGDDVVLLASLLAIPGMSGKIGYRYLSAESGLHLACQHGSLGCVTILCKRGANTEVYDVNSIRAADYLPQTNMLPVLVASSIRQCFSTDVSSVIFQQALKALGDLVDLENMRKSSVTLTAQRLGLDKDTFSHSDHKPSSISSMIKEWAKQTQEMCITIESLYTEVYSRCRNKAWGTTGSHDLLPPTILEALRSADFDDRVNIISAIKRKIGAVPEDPLLHWKSAERSIALKSLDQYLDTATSMIKDYSDLTGPNSLSYC
ncbi:MAG: hypothetical protein LQ345_007098, partial [Seirophora villosa]